jgi:hypothetical protein
MDFWHKFSIHLHVTYFFHFNPFFSIEPSLTKHNMQLSSNLVSKGLNGEKTKFVDQIENFKKLHYCNP